jgi:hypothetical protein
MHPKTPPIPPYCTTSPCEPGTFDAGVACEPDAWESAQNCLNAAKGPDAGTGCY